MRLPWKLAIAGALGSMVACTFTRNLDYLSREDGTVDPDTGETPAAEQKDADQPDTAKVETDAGVGCEAGTIRPPTSSFPFAIPVPDGVTAQAAACLQENVLADDGKTTNLDRTMNGDVGRTTLQGKLIAGCVGVQFDHDLEVVTVKLGPVADGCGVSPCLVGAADGCGTSLGRQAYVFVGLDAQPENLRLLTQLKYNDQVETLRTVLAEQASPITNARVVVVCRDGNVSATRDDVGVDAVWDECK